MYKAASDGQNSLGEFTQILKGSALASVGGIALIVVLLLVCAAVMNAAVPDPDSYIHFFLFAAVSVGCLTTGYASAVLTGKGLAAALLSAAMITILTSALALLFGGTMSFGNHLIMIICVCVFSCAGGYLKSRGKGLKKHHIKPKKNVRRPVKH
ncbi:MAG: hypothetical protein AB9835_00410 [Eubacteriales bacterium]